MCNTIHSILLPTRGITVGRSDRPVLHPVADLTEAKEVLHNG